MCMVFATLKCVVVLNLTAFNALDHVYLCFSVLLLLSILTVQGSGCNDFMKTTIRNLQDTVNNERTNGFVSFIL